MERIESIELWIDANSHDSGLDSWFVDSNPDVVVVGNRTGAKPDVTVPPDWLEELNGRAERTPIDNTPRNQCNNKKNIQAQRDGAGGEKFLVRDDRRESKRLGEDEEVLRSYYESRFIDDGGEKTRSFLIFLHLVGCSVD